VCYLTFVRVTYSVSWLDFTCSSMAPQIPDRMIDEFPELSVSEQHLEMRSGISSVINKF
jgi:hypothetical protein